MKSLFKISLILKIILFNSFCLAQEVQSAFPKFIPYVCNDSISIIENNFNIIDLGKEQPARWLFPDPLADKYPGWSPYNYCMNNPVNLVDPDGRWPWIANINYHWFQGTTPWHFKEQGNTSFSSLAELDVKRYTRDLSGFVDIWFNKNNSNYSPNHASYLKNNSIAVAIRNDLYNEDIAAYYEGTFEENGRTFDKIVLDERSFFKSIQGDFIHELTHAMFPNEGEYGAYAVEYSLGIYSNEYIESIKNKLGLTEYQKKLLKNNPDFFFNNLRKKGEELRGVQ